MCLAEVKESDSLDIALTKATIQLEILPRMVNFLY